jgi:hypothetical protein
VDVVNRSGGVGRAGYTGDRDGVEDFAQRVIERAITVYNKPFATYSAAVGTIQVNDYAGPEMLRRNRQLAPPYRDTINSVVWDLPNGLVNVVVAPSLNLETDSRYEPQEILWPDGQRHSFSDDTVAPLAPAGYVIGSNNSPAIPVVSGVLADLISEAKREHVRYNALRLNNAIFTGTRLLDGFPLSQQGYGLINATHALNQLAKMAKADDPKELELTSFTTSRLAAGKMVNVQGFHADLSKVSEKLDAGIWITRHGGYAGGRKYAFALRGNNGSFELLDRGAVLERDNAVEIHFRTNGASGWNIVFLELRDVEADVVMQDIPLSVRVPDAPQNVAAGVDKYESNIPPLRTEYRYVHVGADVQAARYVIRAPYVGPDSLLYAPGLRSRNVTPPGDPMDAAHHVGPMEELESLVVNGTPGTQKIVWENRGRPEYRSPNDPPAPDVAIHAELTVSKYAVALTKDGRELTISNKLADIEGKVELSDAKLGSSDAKGEGAHASVEIRRTLPAHLSQWRVAVSTESLPPDSTDAFLLNCTDAKNGCGVVAQAPLGQKGATLLVEEPKEGAWLIVIRTRARVDRVAEYKVREALLVPSAPPVEQTDGKHASGTVWSVTLPPKHSDAQYAAFHIAGHAGEEGTQNGGAKNGVTIALTSLESDAP